MNDFLMKYINTTNNYNINCNKSYTVKTRNDNNSTRNNSINDNRYDNDMSEIVNTRYDNMSDIVNTRNDNTTYMNRGNHYLSKYDTIVKEVRPI